METNDVKESAAQGIQGRATESDQSADQVTDAPSHTHPESIGGYRIECQIGSGGMSNVFRARTSDQELPVALKVIDARFAAESAMRQRFQREVKAIQSLKHDHIVPMYSYGDDQGTPYLAMRFIDGVTLSELIQHLRHESERPKEDSDTLQRADTPTCTDLEGGSRATASTCLAAARTHDSVFEDIAELIASAADAIDEAHRNGIIHRDIKPSNMMIDREGQLWLTDFGLASVDEVQTIVTKSGEMIGTPHYMSPEQATADRNSIDHRTDIYSLGATLYELATLKRPYQGDRFRVLMEVSTGRLSPPSQVCPNIPKPLEAIILKSMAYSPMDRYQSGAAMAEDLRRFARGKVISARQLRLSDRAVKWIVRNPRTSIGTALTFSTVGLLLIAMMYRDSRHLEVFNSQLKRMYSWQQEMHLDLANAYDKLDQSRTLLTHHLYVADVAAAYRAYALRDVAAVHQQLSRHIPRAVTAPDQPERDLRGFEWRLLYNLCQPPDGSVIGEHQGAAREVALVPGKSACVTVGDDGMVRYWGLDDVRANHAYEIGNSLDAVAISPNDDVMVVGQNGSSGINRVAIRKVQSGDILQKLKGHQHSVESVAFSPDGNMVATADRYKDIFLQSSNGELLGRINNGSRNESLAFSPDGKSLVAIVRGENRLQSLQKFSVPELRLEDTLHLGFSANVFAFSGNGQYVMVANADHLALCQWPDGKKLYVADRLRGRLRCVALNDDATALYAGCDNGSLYVWDIDPSSRRSDSPVQLPLPEVIPTGNLAVNSIKIASENRAVIATEDGAIQVWKTSNARKIPYVLDPIVRSVATAKASSKELVVRMRDGAVAKLNLFSKEIRLLQDVPPDSEQHVAQSPDGRFIVASAPGELIVICSDDGHVITRIKVRIRNDPTDGLAFSADGTRLFHLLNDRFEVYGVGPDEESWNRIKEVRLQRDGVRGVTVSPKDGRIVVSVSATSELLFFDGETYKLLDSLPCHFGSFTAVHFSDDGELLMLGCGDGTVEVRDANLQQINLFHGHLTTVNHCTMINDNRTMITGSDDQIRFWDLPSGRELGVLASDDAITSLHYCPSEDSLFAFFSDVPVQVWPTKR